MSQTRYSSAPHSCITSEQWSEKVRRAKCFCFLLLRRAKKRFCFLLDRCAPVLSLTIRKHVSARCSKSAFAKSSFAYLVCARPDTTDLQTSLLLLNNSILICIYISSNKEWSSLEIDSIRITDVVLILIFSLYRWSQLIVLSSLITFSYTRSRHGSQHTSTAVDRGEVEEHIARVVEAVCENSRSS
jgi:hypothetical protein